MFWSFTERLILYNCLKYRFKIEKELDFSKLKDKNYLFDVLPYLHSIKIMKYNNITDIFYNKNNFYSWLTNYPIVFDNDTKTIKIAKNNISVNLKMYIINDDNEKEYFDFIEYLKKINDFVVLYKFPNFSLMYTSYIIKNYDVNLDNLVKKSNVFSGGSFVINQNVMNNYMTNKDYVYNEAIDKFKKKEENKNYYVLLYESCDFYKIQDWLKGEFIEENKTKKMKIIEFKNDLEWKNYFFQCFI